MNLHPPISKVVLYSISNCIYADILKEVLKGCTVTALFELGSDLALRTIEQSIYQTSPILRIFPINSEKTTTIEDWREILRFSDSLLQDSELAESNPARRSRILMAIEELDLEILRIFQRNKVSLNLNERTIQVINLARLVAREERSTLLRVILGVVESRTIEDFQHLGDQA